MLFKVCRKKKHEARPGEILDQVISQSSSIANKCLLYKLANYKRGKLRHYALAQIAKQLAEKRHLKMIVLIETFDIAIL